MIAPATNAGMAFDAYAAAPGVSTSMLKRLAEAPAKARLAGWRETPALAMGTLVHTAVLEPLLLEDRYAVTDLKRTGTKAWVKAAENAGNRILVKRPDFDAARTMRDAVLAHPVAGALLTPEMLVELSIWWRHAGTGLLRKGRPDGLRRDLGAVVDVKTTTDASPGEFVWAARRYRYAWQAASYFDAVEAAEGWRPQAFILLAVEKEPPHLVAAYEITEADIAAAAEQVDAALRRWAECEAAEAAGAAPRAAWPGYPDHLMPLELDARGSMQGHSPWA